ncbi:MAG: hypothetical protein RJA34_25, partial [Pseudomonadota bacterium]
MIVVLDDYQGIAQGLSDWKAIPGQPQIRFITQYASSEDELIEWVRDADVVVAMRERTAFPGHVIERLPRLQLLATTGQRNAAIDLDTCCRRGIVVTGALGGRTGRTSTAETAWALILALTKNVLTSH